METVSELCESIVSAIKDINGESEGAMTEAERLKIVRRALINEGYTPEDAQRAILRREGHWIVYLDGERIGIYDFMRGAFID